MNKHLKPSTWKRNYDNVDGPCARFAGQVAHDQLLDGLDFVNEQPTGSYMYREPPWPTVLKHPRVSSVRFDQCQLGQKNSHGDPVKKPTELVLSDENLGYYFKDLKCGRFPKRYNGNMLSSLVEKLMLHAFGPGTLLAAWPGVSFA